jgi:membrane-bound inhibitor of C-type lysozyme
VLRVCLPCILSTSLLCNNEAPCEAAVRPPAALRTELDASSSHCGEVYHCGERTITVDVTTAAKTQNGVTSCPEGKQEIYFDLMCLIESLLCQIVSKVKDLHPVRPPAALRTELDASSSHCGEVYHCGERTITVDATTAAKTQNGVTSCPEGKQEIYFDLMCLIEPRTSFVLEQRTMREGRSEEMQLTDPLQGSTQNSCIHSSKVRIFCLICLQHECYSVN